MCSGSLFVTGLVLKAGLYVGQPGHDIVPDFNKILAKQCLNQADDNLSMLSCAEFLVISS